LADGPLGIAAAGQPTEGESDLDLGRSTGRYRVLAIPLFTPINERGPEGEGAVAAIIELLSLRQPAPRKKADVDDPGLFKSDW
jgi:hypothetical protein